MHECDSIPTSHKKKPYDWQTNLNNVNESSLKLSNDGGKQCYVNEIELIMIIPSLLQVNNTAGDSEKLLWATTPQSNPPQVEFGFPSFVFVSLCQSL